ncbi:O-acyltransferase WSD1, partial [Bienertia sinuspersici]
QIENKKGRKVWKKVTANVEDHITVASFPEELSAENYSKHFNNYISKIATSQLPPNKPLWELHIINCPQGHTPAGVFILKVDHAIGDGTSLMGMVFSGFKRVDDPSLPITFPSKTRTTSKNDHNVANHMINIFKTVPRFMSTIFYSLYDVGQSIRLACSEDTETPIRSGSTDMTRPFSTRICSLNLPLNDVKKIKTLLGVVRLLPLRVKALLLFLSLLITVFLTYATSA